MSKAGSLRLWDVIHRWSSLVCTLFMLVLGVTGLPLIFHEEINHALGKDVSVPSLGDGVHNTDMDRVVHGAQTHFADRKVLFVSREAEEGRVWYVTMAPSPKSPELVQAAVDARTGSVLAEPAVGDSGIMGFVLKLHVELFAGLAGELFLGVMGVLLVLSIVSGVLLYAPFMRSLSFGEIRRGRGDRVKWLDLHNLTGAVTLVWLLVVAATGVVNSFATLIVGYWQRHQLADVTSAYVGRPAVTQLFSLQRAVDVAKAREEGLEVAFVAYPGTSFTSAYHYGIFMRGATALTSRLVHPVFVDARDGTVTASPQPPWYITALLLSEPLHFGDYGGTPMKVIWAALDIVGITVIGSGLYLWVRRRRFA